MTVAIDSGNSWVKLARVADGRVGRVERLPSRPAPDPRTLAQLIVRLGATDAAHRLVALVSVVPDVTEAVREAARATGARLLLADTATIPMQAHVAQPARLGGDRLLAAWGARAARGAPVIVVDLGTATTVDAVDADGCFAGGAILPGLEMALGSLARGTALLPEVTLGPPPSAIGRDVVAAIRSGVVLGHVGAIRELVDRMCRELAPAGSRPGVIATGGATLAPWARDALLLPTDAGEPIADAVDPDLLLRSLGALAALQPVPAR